MRLRLFLNFGTVWSMGLLLSLLLDPSALWGQFDEPNHPELRWEILETDHFKVYYHQGLTSLAKRGATAAESAYGPITSFYEFEPDDKIRLIFKDVEDAANGMAFYYHNTIEIWASSLGLDFEFRGTKSDWLSNVISHEFTHMISLQTARKGARRVPALYFHYFGYQSEGRRDDILTGYPNLLASYAFPMTVIPPWFAEGTAQYMAEGARHDRWDSHRDMILRMASLSETLLTYDEMGVFGAKIGLGFEKVYNHGYSLVLFITTRYGEEKLREIYRNMATWWRVDFSGALQLALGISGRELHRQWAESLEERYGIQKAQLDGNEESGRALFAEGYSNFHPRWSPDGGRIAFASNAGGDYGQTNLFVLNLADSTEKMIAPGARGSSAWSGDASRLLFSRRSEPNRYGSRFRDLYEVDPEAKGSDLFGWAKKFIGLSSGKRPGERRLSQDLRGLYPAYSPDGSEIVFSKNGSGTTNLALLNPTSGAVRNLTDYDDGSQVFTPRWSPDGERIAFSLIRSDGNRDIAVIPAAGGTPELLIASSETDRDPSWTSDGKGLVFASDVDGTFNLYHFDLENVSFHRITRVLGGAIQPDVNPRDGRIAFSYYGEEGYEIRTVDREGVWERVSSETFRPNGITTSTQPDSATAEIAPSRSYGNEFSTLMVLPRFAYDNGRPKIGIFAGSDDVLRKQTLFLGGLISRNLDMDLFALFEYRRWRPTVFLEAYRITRHVEEDVLDRDFDFRIFERTFSLNEIDLGISHRLRQGGLLDGRFIYSRYSWILDQSRYNGLNRATVGATYLNGFDLAFSYKFKAIPRAIDSEINPRSGREITFRYDRFFNYFLRDFEENSSLLIEVFDHYFYNQLTFDWTEHIPLGPGRNALGLRFYGGWIDKTVDDFFDFHVGGLSYLKGYTFYSLEGRRAAMLKASYRLPLWRRIDRQVGPIYSDQIYGAVYSGIGRAWDGDENDDLLDRGWKRDIGAQIRYEATSFHVFPTRISFDVAYGFDTAPLLEPSGLREKSGLKFYFTLLFGYLQSVGEGQNSKL